MRPGSFSRSGRGAGRAHRPGRRRGAVPGAGGARVRHWGWHDWDRLPEARSSGTCWNARRRRLAGITPATGGTPSTSAVSGCRSPRWTRRKRAHHQASWHWRPGVVRHGPRAAALRGARSRARYVTPDVVVDLTAVALDRPRSGPGTRLGRPRPPATADRCAGFPSPPVAGRARPCSPTAGRTRPPKAGMSSESLQLLAVHGAWTSRSGSSRSSAPTVSGRGCATRATVAASRAKSPPGSPGARATQATATAVQRLVGLVALSGPPGLQGIGRRRRGPNPPAELVDITPVPGRPRRRRARPAGRLNSVRT